VFESEVQSVISIFIKRVKELISDDNYRRLQVALVNNPEFGDVIKGSGGL
jgi:hypothetical protein